jgi:hypothetical protein
MTILQLNSDGGPALGRLPQLVVALVGALTAAFGGAWVGTEIGEIRALSELAGLCERMPDIALDNPSMCLHIETMLPRK